jgi:hypothetical protein
MYSFFFVNLENVFLNTHVINKCGETVLVVFDLHRSLSSFKSLPLVRCLGLIF